MEYETIKVSVKAGVAVLCLNRPNVSNELNTVMRDEIAHAARFVPDDARVLVLTGEGPSFCSGQDLGNRINLAEPDFERIIRDEYIPMLDALTNCPLPTLAAVNGAAAGAGASLALAADVVIAAESAYFLQAFTRIGLIPDAGGTWCLPKQVGLARAMGMALFSDRIPAKIACEWGLIWEAVPDEMFAEHWQRRAGQLANGPTRSFLKIREAIRSSYASTYREQLEIEARLQGEAGKSRDFKEGILAFIQKRQPNFEGR
ncbi:MAG: enoyl-CoA hydratase-related protein [Rhodobacteraceae bacterium]|nr:enoyl-CoA hydratase-related protein [Paracoccaceae bacterium]